MSATRAKAPILAWLLTALSCLLAGMAVFAVRPAPPVASGSAATAASRAAVVDFYEAVNAVIATGNAAPLAAVLTPDYAQSDATGALIPGRVALERSLRALHEMAPDLWLDVTDLVGDGDRVVAIVATRGTERATALGLPLIAPTLWGPIDVFRVADGRVAARTGETEPGTLLERRVTVPLDLPLPSVPVVTVQRASIAPAASRSASASDGPIVLIGETGPLAVAVAGTTPGGEVTTLAAGDWLVLPADTAYQAHNAGREPAVLLEVLATATTPPPGVEASRAEGVTMRVLAGGLLTPVPQGRVVLTTGRLTLTPGARLAWAGPVGVTMLVVEAGTLELATDGASAWVRSALSGENESRRSATLTAGDGARIGIGTGAEIRNVGDDELDVLVVTLLWETGERALTD